MSIRHLENLKPHAMLHFVSTWNNKNSEYEVTEKIDGNSMVFGASKAKLYLGTKNKKYPHPRSIPDVFYLDCFKHAFHEFKKVHYKEIIDAVGDTFELRGELISTHDHNLIIYDKKKIGDGVFVVFGSSMNFDMLNFVVENINMYSRIKVIPVPLVKTAGFKFDKKLVSLLESLVVKNNDLLKRPARTLEDKTAKNKILEKTKNIGKSFKDDFLAWDKLEPSFGQEFEGVVFSHITEKPVKIVNSDLFLNRKKVNWHYMDQLIGSQKRFLRSIQQSNDYETIPVLDKLFFWQKEVKDIKKQFYQNLDSFTIPRKIVDTEKNITLLEKRIEYLKDYILYHSIEKVKEILDSGDFDTKIKG